MDVFRYFRIIEEETREREKHDELRAELVQAEFKVCLCYHSNLSSSMCIYLGFSGTCPRRADKNICYNDERAGCALQQHIRWIHRYSSSHLHIRDQTPRHFNIASDFSEENQLQQQVVAAKAVYDRVEATFDAETQAYDRLYHAEKALHECLEKLKEAVRCATSCQY